MSIVTNDENSEYLINIQLPGAEKDSIKLKVGEERIYVEAKGESIDYAGDYSLCCPIKPQDVKATYKEGLLKIRAPFGDLLKNTIDIEIN
jgi:HSP20 family molecular chaperone IbpA